MDAQRPVVYCLIPAELAPKLHDPLRRHFRDDPGVEVIVERRGGERRSGVDRRTGESEPPDLGERRGAGGIAGRRIAARRAELAPVAELPPLPRGTRRHAGRIVFVMRVEPAGRPAEDADTARVVTRIQAGDREAFSILYTRYYDRVYGYLRAALKDRHEAEDATQDVFVKALRSLPRYKPTSRPFRHWLFSIVRNHALDLVRALARVEPTHDEEIERIQARSAPGPDPGPEPPPEDEPAIVLEDQLSMLDMLTDPDVRVFVERLPEVQRKILILRFMLDLTTAEAAQVLDRSPHTIRTQQSRALRTLEQRLRAIDHPRVRESRMEYLVRPKPARVISRRRFALSAGVTPASSILARDPGYPRAGAAAGSGRW